ncbi:MAG TPA: hypothetical protein VE973_03590 [Candidatus Limnocylindria bacterium]|nr:hypothetical protein [Candidatus Limnocylindria bacterium]
MAHQRAALKRHLHHRFFPNGRKRSQLDRHFFPKRWHTKAKTVLTVEQILLEFWDTRIKKIRSQLKDFDFTDRKGRTPLEASLAQAMENRLLALVAIRDW